MSLSDRIKLVRESLGLSQKDMAKNCSVSVQMWQNYEWGKSVPGGNVLELLARMGINVNWLLTGDGPMWLGPDDAKALEVKEAHEALREKLAKNRVQRQYDMFLGSMPEDARITPEQLTAYINGEFLPTKTQLVELCRLAGGRLREEDFIRTITSYEIPTTMVETELNLDLMALVFEVVQEIDPNNSISPKQKAELAALVYQMNQRTKYTKARLKRFIEAICIFIEQGIDFNKLSDRGLSNLMIEIAHHVVKGEEEK